MNKADLLKYPLTELEGFGRYPRSRARVVPVWEDFMAGEALRRRGDFRFLARGTGLSYADASLNAGNICLAMKPLNRFLAFDADTGLLHIEAGVTLKEILEFAIPRGYFLPVTPGTAHPTIGGCVACDVHGKSKLPLHNYVKRLHMMLADGSQIACSPDKHPDLFYATCGGMGLTGVVLSVEIDLMRIKSSYIRYEGIRASNLEAIFHEFDNTDEWPMTVAWIDCVAGGGKLGQSIMMKGRFAEPHEVPRGRNPLQVANKLKLTVPFNFPSWALNKYTVSAFNFAYQAKHPKKLETLMDYESFFYPLDAISHWNRIYGKPGLLQYQFLIPPEVSLKGIRTLLEMISATGKASFLAVLKKFGEIENRAPLSFPKGGFFLALDFPYGDGRILENMRDWDKKVLDFGGRLYLAKDGRMDRSTFETMYPRVAEFKQVKTKYDPGCVFQSDMGRRLGLVR